VDSFTFFFTSGREDFVRYHRLKVLTTVTINSTIFSEETLCIAGKSTDVSEEGTASVFKVEYKQESCGS
jgi:hypothetical protein